MRYYPLCLDIKDRNCLVVGGGGVGTRKVETLLGCGAVVTVVSLEFSARLEALARKGRVRLERRVYRSQDLEGQFLVIGATGFFGEGIAFPIVIMVIGVAILVNALYRD